MAIEKVFVDTSAFYALMDRSDSYHEKAKQLWTFLLDEESYFKTTNYIIIETLVPIFKKIKSLNLLEKKAFGPSFFIIIIHRVREDNEKSSNSGG